MVACISGISHSDTRIVVTDIRHAGAQAFIPLDKHMISRPLYSGIIDEGKNGAVDFGHPVQATSENDRS